MASPNWWSSSGRSPGEVASTTSSTAQLYLRNHAHGIINYISIFVCLQLQLIKIKFLFLRVKFNFFGFCVCFCSVNFKLWNSSNLNFPFEIQAEFFWSKCNIFHLVHNFVPPSRLAAKSIPHLSYDFDDFNLFSRVFLSGSGGHKVSAPEPAPAPTIAWNCCEIIFFLLRNLLHFGEILLT